MKSTCSVCSVLLCCALGLTVVACGGVSTQLRGHVAAGEYQTAQGLCRGNAERELELALLILEDSATGLGDPGEPLEQLGHVGRRGLPMLERLEEFSDVEVAHLARLYLLRGDLPDDHQRADYLDSGYSSVRRAFLTTFGRQLDAQTLAAALIDIDPAVRILAIRALGSKESTPASARAARQATVKDPDISVRLAAAEHPAAFGSKATAYEVLSGLLLEEELGIQLAAIRGLGKIATPEAIRRLEELAARPVCETAIAAGAELVRNNRDAGQAVLEAALSHEQPGLRMAALLQLERIGAPGINDALTRAINDEIPDVALLAAELAMPRRGNLTRQALVRAKELYANSENPQLLRDRARNLLAAQGYSAALAEIEELLGGSEAAAIAALIPQIQRIGALRPQFAGLLAHADAAVRLQAAYAVIANTRS